MTEHVRVGCLILYRVQQFPIHNLGPICTLNCAVISCIYLSLDIVCFGDCTFQMQLPISLPRPTARSVVQCVEGTPSLSNVSSRELAILIHPSPFHKLYSFCQERGRKSSKKGFSRIYFWK